MAVTIHQLLVKSNSILNTSIILNPNPDTTMSINE